MTRGRIVVLALIAATVVLGATAGAGSGAAVQRIDLSSRAAIDNYLISIGVDPEGVVVQRGARVYAGLNCPGKGWRCTKSTRVFQLAYVQNKFECTPVAAQVPPTSQGTNDCFIQQFGPGKNEAKCTLENSDSTTPSTIAQICSITQTNTVNDNVSTIKMLISQTAANGDQSGDQQAEVNQQNGSGDNFSTIEQRISQTENTSAVAIAQSQTSRQTFDLVQTADSGTQKSTAKQTQQLTQNASNSQTGTQYQDSFFEGDVFQDSTGVSHSTNQQTEQQTQIAGSLAVDQTQFGPIRCCSFQGTNPEDHFTIQQTSIQKQKPGPPFDQSNQVNGDCFSYGKCTVQSSVQEELVDAKDNCTSQGFTGSEGDSPNGCSTNVTCEGGVCTTEPPCEESCSGIDLRRGHTAGWIPESAFRPLARLLSLSR